MDTRTTFPLTEAAPGAPGAGHAGACGCGEAATGAPELDVRTIPHSIRHAAVLGAWSAIPAGGSLVLLAPHDPQPLLGELAELGPITVTYLHRGPDAWRLRVTHG